LWQGKSRAFEDYVCIYNVIFYLGKSNVDVAGCRDNNHCEGGDKEGGERCKISKTNCLVIDAHMMALQPKKASKKANPKSNEIIDDSNSDSEIEVHQHYIFLGET